MSSLASTIWRVAGWVGVALMAAAALMLAVSGQLQRAAQVGTFGVLGALTLRLDHRSPAPYQLLVVLAAGLNATGYAFDLYHEPLVFDDITHFYSTFAVMLLIGSHVVARRGLERREDRLLLGVALVSVGMALGVAWELIEWAGGFIGSVEDTMLDLLMDTGGSLAAAVHLLVLSNRPSAR